MFMTWRLKQMALWYKSIARFYTRVPKQCERVKPCCVWSWSNWLTSYQMFENLAWAVFLNTVFTEVTWKKLISWVPAVSWFLPIRFFHWWVFRISLCSTSGFRPALPISGFTWHFTWQAYKRLLSTARRYFFILCLHEYWAGSFHFVVLFLIKPSGFPS